MHLGDDVLDVQQLREFLALLDFKYDLLQMVITGQCGHYHLHIRVALFEVQNLLDELGGDKLGAVFHSVYLERFSINLLVHQLSAQILRELALSRAWNPRHNDHISLSHLE